jgi:2-C-methyl-D-erythritol 2,4-cyclodiphosphate synthase
VWLCGVKVPHECALEGHSDADAGLHALTDAILGALASADIGAHFPPSDERWRGAPSHLFLSHAASLVRDQGGIISSVDVTLICEMPKIAPHRDAMRARIGETLGIELARVSVKATTPRAGLRSGVRALPPAVATIRLPFVSHWPRRFATCFGVGWVRAPGTVAQLMALPFGWLLVLLGWQSIFAAALLATGLESGLRRLCAANRSMTPANACWTKWPGNGSRSSPLQSICAAVMAPLCDGVYFLPPVRHLKPWPVSAVEK